MLPSGKKKHKDIKQTCLLWSHKKAHINISMFGNQFPELIFCHRQR
jgi:hypothetical protein